MKVRNLVTAALVCSLAVVVAGCSGNEAETAENAASSDLATREVATQGAAAAAPAGDVLAAYPADTFDGIVDRELVSLDAEGCDGTPSILITAEAPTTYHLYETGDIDVENALIAFQAKVRTDGLEGDAVLEMWCIFDEMGEFFSRSLDNPVSGTMDWTDAVTAFRLEAGQNPDNIKLNLVVTGPGRVWIDDIRVTKAPLP
jgi:hypothetical protein